jgi:hypothetical protein
VSNKDVVRKINVPSRPAAGATQAKPDDYDDTKRKGNKPPVSQTEFEAKDSPGAATDSAAKQAKDTTRSWWKPMH